MSYFEKVSDECDIILKMNVCCGSVVTKIVTLKNNIIHHEPTA